MHNDDFDKSANDYLLVYAKVSHTVHTTESHTKTQFNNNAGKLQVGPA